MRVFGLGLQYDFLKKTKQNALSRYMMLFLAEGNLCVG